MLPYIMLNLYNLKHNNFSLRIRFRNCKNSMKRGTNVSANCFSLRGHHICHFPLNGSGYPVEEWRSVGRVEGTEVEEVKNMGSSQFVSIHYPQEHALVEIRP